MKEFFGNAVEVVKSVGGKIVAVAAGVGLAIASNPVTSHAAFTLPTMPVTDMETAGGTVAAFVCTVTIIGCVIRMIKRA